MIYDLVLEGRILQGGAPIDVFICIKDELIIDIRKTTPGKGAMGKHHRFGSSLILPGAIDTHVHFRDPGMTKKEDITSGSISAAFGGVTTVIDMPNTKPPTIDRTSLKEKDRTASSGSVIDFGLNLAILNSSDLVSVGLLLSGKGGVTAPAGLKAFLGETTGSLVLDPIEALEKWAPLLGSTGAIISLHAEDGSLFNTVKNEEKVRDVLKAHNLSRPAEAEASAISRAVKALGDNVKNAHILHVSTKLGLDAAKGSGASIEVTPHHLLLDVKWGEKNLEEQAMGKVNPPLRTSYDRAALWKGIQDGTVCTFGSDHAPHQIDEKSNGLLSPSGMPGVETMVPLMLVEVKRRKLSLDRFIQLVSKSPAERFDITLKGTITKGAHADLMVVDLKNERKMDGDALHSKCGWTPYEGMPGIFPFRVYSRGELIIEDDALCAKPGRGRNIRE